MMESTKRGLSEPCPDPGCGKQAGEKCYAGSPHIHPSRRNLFFIDSGKKKSRGFLIASGWPHNA